MYEKILRLYAYNNGTMDSVVNFSITNTSLTDNSLSTTIKSSEHYTKQGHYNCYTVM